MFENICDLPSENDNMINGKTLKGNGEALRVDGEVLRGHKKSSKAIGRG